MGVRYARLVVVAIIVGVGLSQVLLSIADWHLKDMGAYWEAAWRMREGQPLYPAITNPEASEVYRYAPWFAWAWVPLTYLPRELVNVLWSATLVGASAAALLPLWRERAMVAMALFGSILIAISATGNVQALLVAALVLGLERRTGPVWIALAASLKVVPILFVVTYLGRREWRRAAAAIGLTAVLVAPMLRHDLTHYPTSAGAAGTLISIPVLYAIVVATGIAVSLRLARSDLGWLASASMVVMAVPRFFVYDLTFLLAAVPATERVREIEAVPEGGWESVRSPDNHGFVPRRPEPAGAPATERT